MIMKRSLILIVSLALSSCASNDNRGRISELESVDVDIKEVNIEGGLDKAMESYQKFLEKTPESELTPEAMRRLADLKVEKEYGIVTDGEVVDSEDTETATATKPKAKEETKAKEEVTAKEPSKTAATAETSEGKPSDQGEKTSPIADISESQKDFEQRATAQQAIESSAGDVNAAIPAGEPGADLQNAGAAEAIELYNKLLAKYPMYERNDQVLYQLSRAYEETGQVDEAMKVVKRLIKQYPNSRYIDEVQFRLGEYYFIRKKYLDAEEAYTAVLAFGVGSVYYDRALFKKGWTFYKQELYEEALHEFIALLDYKVSIGYDFEQTEDQIEKKRIDDTFRVVSLSFSNLGGATSVEEYFANHGSRAYEDHVYSHLAEFYFTKRRYSDAATTYNTFVDNNPFHRKSPHFSMRVIDIYMKGGFPRLVIEAKKQYASTYGINAEYWNYFDQKEFPEVLGYLKTNLVDLANHYHSLYQNKKFVKDKAANFAEASRWYREFLTSFPKDEQSPAINYQLADLLLENRDFNLAAIEYERTAYDYPVNEKSPKAAYAAVYAYREHLKGVAQVQQFAVKRDIIRSSIRLVDTFPNHEKATVVLGAAVDDLFAMQDYEEAIKNGQRLLSEYPNAETPIKRGAWLVVAHSSFELENFADAETGYSQVLALTAKGDKSRQGLVENLAASIYKQGEQAKKQEEYKTAVHHFLRIASAAPNSKIRPAAEYDAAAVLIKIMDLEQAATVLLAFRENYPGHELQHDVTKKIAFVYKELERYTLAGREFERVAAEANPEDEDIIREAMLTAAEMYEKAEDTDNSLRVYKAFVVKFPKPLEFALETYYKIAMLYKSRDDLNNYRKTLQYIITADASAGAERTDRTKYLAAQASLVIIEPRFDAYIALKLVKPLEKSLKQKQKAMKDLVSSYSKLVDYQVADVTAASTFYIAEIYYNFSRALMESERPEGLSALELEEFNLALEDQAFPFEDKAIGVHEKNVELLTIGVYSPWIDRSIEKLAKLIPARYAKYEERMAYIDDIQFYRYSSPRFVREDAATVYVEHIDFFRYVSQIPKNDHQETAQSADKIKQEGLESDQSGADSNKALSEQTVTETQQQNDDIQPATESHQEPSSPSTADTLEAAEQAADAVESQVETPVDQDGVTGGEPQTDSEMTQTPNDMIEEPVAETSTESVDTPTQDEAQTEQAADSDQPVDEQPVESKDESVQEKQVEQDGALTQEGSDVVESKPENEQAATAAVRDTSVTEGPVAEGKE
jgi:tetratricopeptide (TPR) repeat protein